MNLKKMMVGLVIVAFLLVIGFVGTLFWFQVQAGMAESKKNTEETNVKTVVHKMESAIVSNLKDDDKRYIRVTVELTYKDDKKFTTELTENDGLASTTIITALRGKKVADVTDPQAPVLIGKELVEALNKAYHTDKFVSVNFREFITQ